MALKRGDKITADSMNQIQKGLDEITNLWRISPINRRFFSAGDVTNARYFDDWIDWLKSYAKRIGCASYADFIQGVAPGDLMLPSYVNTVLDQIPKIKNYCNRSECNRSECNYNGESNKRESDHGECHHSAECNFGEHHSH